jgi:hypothetical protein
LEETKKAQQFFWRKQKKPTVSMASGQGLKYKNYKTENPFSPMIGCA